ncbi:iron ABC transporter permease [Compostibacter hankyongensis]|uniref:Iron ABC transporter permease n=1 Tax=Compostibacter hankyongensis TaxID=1007089 RepID=A0ABP8FQZ3_9BACT
MSYRKLQWILVVLMIVAALLSAGTGAMAISPVRIMAILLDRAGWHLPVYYDEGMAAVLLQIRLPRVLMGMLVGAGLAVSGAAIQGLFRNPLADPGLVGISAGASLAAVLFIVVLATLPAVTNSALLPHYLLNLVTFAGACMTSLLVFRISRWGGRTLITTLLLAGLALNALCSAFTGLVISTADNEQLRSITFWTLGSLGGASWDTVLALLPFVLLPLILLSWQGKALNAFSLGEPEAAHIGVNVKKLKGQIILLSTLAVGACVAVSGVIGFVGLVVPHMLRSVIGSDHRRLLPACACLGAALLTLADMLCRTVIAPAELPIGIVTALLGSPLFIVLLMKQKKYLFGLA